MNAETINIRDIQHYMYCPRRFALLSLNRDWSENAFVVKANILHEHVHDGSHEYSDKNKIVRSAVTLYNDLPEYEIFGVTDCIEFYRKKDGITVAGHEGTFGVRLVEYKPKAPKGTEYNETDAIQVFAQKLCADFVWGCDSEAYIYYTDTRKRVKLPFDTEYDRYDAEIKELLAGMRKLLAEEIIPERKRGQKCSGCSIADLCFPKTPEYNVRDMIMSMKGGGDD